MQPNYAIMRFGLQAKASSGYRSSRAYLAGLRQDALVLFDPVAIVLAGLC
jgi:hypothetical protein